MGSVANYRWERESAAGKALLYRIPEVTAPWNPEPLFADGEQVLA